MLNEICIQGRIANDLALKTTNGGKPVLSFTIACERDSADKTVDFLDVVCFNSTAEFVNNFFKKGSSIIVTGRLQSRKWEDKNGNKRINWEILSNRCYFCGKNEVGEPVRPQSVFVEEEDIEGELPFE